LAFQIKDFVSIVASQINHARSVTDKVTDFQPGSVVRTIMESPAVEIEELYLQMLLGLRDAIPVATFLSFGFDRLPAKRAMGYVSLSQAIAPIESFVIPKDTIFSTLDGRNYESVAPVTWVAGASFVRILVSSVTPGYVGNVSAGLITESNSFGAEVTISNALIESGADLESDTEREARFASYIESLSRGTLVACVYAARQSRVLDINGNIFEYVTRLGINEGSGRVQLFVYSNRGIPSPELIADGQLRLDGSRNDELGTITPGFRPAGVQVQVLSMVERAVPLSIRLRMLPGYTLNSAALQLLNDVYADAIHAIPPGSTAYLGELVQALLAVTGVSEIVPISTANITCATNEALIAGVLSITAL
jgi:hypothetical protein